MKKEKENSGKFSTKFLVTLLIICISIIGFFSGENYILTHYDLSSTMYEIGRAEADLEWCLALDFIGEDEYQLVTAGRASLKTAEDAEEYCEKLLNAVNTAAENAQKILEEKKQQ